ncbi:hypothetical protein [Paenibacillus crassostreae]|nr:hypothetical protein [Paenibacillus crassostreae]
MDKDQYFKNLEEIISDPIFIVLSKGELEEEINNNMWRITLDNSS